MIVEHARVALIVVAVIVVMSHGVGRNAEVARLRTRRSILVIGARSKLSISAEDVVDHEPRSGRLQHGHRSAALHLYRDGHSRCDVREGVNFRGYKWAVVAHQSVPLKYDLETVSVRFFLKVRDNRKLSHTTLASFFLRCESAESHQTIWLHLCSRAFLQVGALLMLAACLLTHS